MGISQTTLRTTRTMITATTKFPGSSKVVKDKDIRHSDYRESLFSSLQMTHKQTRIMQEEHELYTVETKKTSLSPLNDKKWITRDGDTFTTFSFGHYMIKDHELAELLIS